MIFTWDENKNTLNKRKHKVSFTLAQRVFADEFRIEYYDEHHSDDEDRWIAVGAVQGVFLKVCFTLRGEEIRLISARRADEKDKRNYYNQSL